MLCHHIYHALFVVSRVSFELKPHYFVVIMEAYMDFIYLIDMVRCFTEPYVVEDNKIVRNRKKIASRYIKTWFILDLYAFYPLALLRYNSNWERGTENPFEMFLVQNFERLNRLYKFMLLM
jgi:hypothetical protein